MWTEKNSRIISKASNTFEPPNRFVLPAFYRHLEDLGYPKTAAKMRSSLQPKLAGWMAIDAAASRHVCCYCESQILQPTSITCTSCLKIPEARVLADSIRLSHVEESCEATYGKGVKNPMQAKSVKAKHQRAIDAAFGDKKTVRRIVANRRKTSNERYGVKHYCCTEEGRQRLSEIQKHNNEVRGDEIKAKRETTCLRDYGVRYVAQSPEVKAKHAATCLERHGHINAAWGEEARKKRALSMRSTVEVDCDGKTYLCSGFERFVIPRLAAKFGTDDVIDQYDDEFESLDLNGHLYTPDAYVKSKDTYVEVKSTHTLWGLHGVTDHFKNNRRKQKLCNLGNIRLKFLLYLDTTKEVLELPKDWHTWSKTQLQDFVLT
jgi:hypothetical protein